MPLTRFTSLDFDQIKAGIKDYLRANTNFSDFDFEGSNFSVLINTLAYNTYINAFNTNMGLNEVFLDSATLRENVISRAREIGYVPRSRTAAKASVSFSAITSSDTPTLTLKKGLVCVGKAANSAYTFSIFDDITTTTSNVVVDGITYRQANFNNIDVYQGVLLQKVFVVNGSVDQRFILDNSFVDTSTIKVHVKGPNDTGLGREFSVVDNIINVNSLSEIYLIQEIVDEKYELLFGDGIFGKKLENGSVITVDYIVTDGEDGNGASEFSYSGQLTNSGGAVITVSFTIDVTTNQSAQLGSEIESIDSIKYYAPRMYSSQYRAVTTRDYESIIKSIYPDTESVSVVGGEELNPPQFGKVQISIKPKNGTFISDFVKTQIYSKLKNYAISGINQEIVDLKILYIEIDSSVYYDSSRVSSTDSLKTSIVNSVQKYSRSVDLNKFGGRFKYSRLVSLIDSVDRAITSNITKIRIRRDLKASINTPAQYELCFGNAFHANPDGLNIKSSGFKVFGHPNVVYLTDVPNSDNKTGVISVVETGIDEIGKVVYKVIVKSAGTVDYEKGEIIINPVVITETSKPNNVIEVQAFPDSNDVIGLKDLYLSFDVSKSTINIVKDTISSGEKISGVGFANISSYPNGNLTR